MPADQCLPRFGFAPFGLSGTVVGALLNHRPQWDAIGGAATRPPHKAPPRAPVLEVKPRNTFAADGASIAVPGEVVVGATLGIVIGRSACRVPEGEALAHVAGYVAVGDLSLPLEGHYRPAARLKARDGFCPIGARVVPAAGLPAPDALALRVSVDGRVVHEATTGERLRGVARLIADVSEFMTLSPGDLLLLGIAQGVPRAAAGARVAIEIDGVGGVAFSLVPEEAT